VLRTKAVAFLARDLQIEASYKVPFLIEMLAGVFPVLSVYFVAKLVGPDSEDSLAKYGGQYFPFAIIGAAFSQYFTVALGAFASTIRRSQMAGCLEAILSTQTSPQTVIVLSALYSFSMKLVHVVIILLLGELALGLDLSRANVLSAGVVLILTVAVFSSLGIFGASVVVIFKKGDPFEWLFGTLSSLLGGALFPVKLLPLWAQTVAMAFPLTHSLDAMRLALLSGYPLTRLGPQLLVLGCMSVLLLPTSVWCFARAVERGRRDGSLMHY